MRLEPDADHAVATPPPTRDASIIKRKIMELVHELMNLGTEPPENLIKFTQLLNGSNVRVEVDSPPTL